MILHRRIHKFKAGDFNEGLQLACQLNQLASEKLGKRGMVYQPSMLGSGMSRRHVVVDTYHDSLGAMEEYYRSFMALAEVKTILTRWSDVEEESWSENFLIVVSSDH